MVFRHGPAWWQDHIGMAGRFVDIKVNRYHEIETTQCFGEPRSIGYRKHGIPSISDESLNLTPSISFYLFRERGGGQFARGLGKITNAAPPARITVIEIGRERRHVDGRRWQHGTADFAHAAPDNIEEVGCEGGESTKPVVAHPNARIGNAP